jgi:predicted MFS family arabinose efflux permease
VFSITAIYRWITVPFNTFLIIYAEKKLGLTTASFGRSVGLMMLLQLPTLLFLGPVLDRFHPTRVAIVSYMIVGLSGLCGFLLVHNTVSFTVVTCVIFVSFAIVQGTTSTLGLRLLPQSRYGQFAAGQAIVGETGMIVLAWLCGRMLDAFGERCLYLWVTVLACLGMVASAILFRAWMKLGGDKAFVPPTVGALG